MSASAALPVVLRALLPGDRNYVRSSWLRSNTHSMFASWPGYYRNHHALIERLLDEATTIVACSDAHAPTICGWACYERAASHVLHYVYVREEFRGFGLARRMVDALPSADVLYTHLTRDVDARRLPPGWRHSLYPLMRTA